MTSSLPLIGIPCHQDITNDEFKEAVYAQGSSYVAAISQAGGIPFLIPLNLEISALRQLYGAASGILLPGGGDIDPVCYNQTVAEGVVLSQLQPARDQTEISLSRWAAAEGKPCLGVCRGSQVMAVAAGGDLYQDLPLQRPDAILHHYDYAGEARNADDYLAHEVRLSPTSCLAQILQSRTVWTNSLHHQAIAHAPAPLQVTGCSTDGVIEVIELPGHPFFIGVQWHPELLVAKQEAARQIFKAFITACQA